MLSRGTISDEEAQKRLVEPRRRCEAAQSELAVLAPPAKVVELHSAGLTRYLGSINDLVATLSRRLVEGEGWRARYAN